MSMGRDENKIYTSEEREILARLRVGSLMICDGGSDPDSDGCGGQGYTGASGRQPCRYCFGVGVMTPELRAALDRPERPLREGTNR